MAEKNLEMNLKVLDCMQNKGSFKFPKEFSDLKDFP